MPINAAAEPAPVSLPTQIASLVSAISALKAEVGLARTLVGAGASLDLIVELEAECSSLLSRLLDLEAAEREEMRGRETVLFPGPVAR